MAALTCSACGKVIIGNGHPSKGKTYCAECYEKLVVELQKHEAEKDALYKYIRKLFGLTQVSQEVMHIIEKLIREGKKIKGIQATLYYYFEISDHELVSPLLIGKIVADQYENAKMYLDSVRKIQEYNNTVDLNVKPMIYKISDSQKEKRKPQKRIEDL